jgi:hypothetical protein
MEMDTSRSGDSPANPGRTHCSIGAGRATWVVMWRHVQVWQCSLAVALAVAVGGARAVAACAGDCDGDGAVGVAELVTGVRISLGENPLSQCAAFDVTPDGVLRIEELIAGVNAALQGCPATPTAMATATASETAGVASPTASETAGVASPTVTPTPAATGTATAPPSATPTVPLVAGSWVEAPLEVVASTCPTPLTEDFAADLASRPPCEQTVEALSDSTVAVEDCTTTRVEGTLDRDGTIRIAYPPTSSTTDDCTIELAVSAVIPAATSPTTASYTFAVGFSEECALADCTIEARGGGPATAPPGATRR